MNVANEPIIQQSTCKRNAVSGTQLTAQPPAATIKTFSPAPSPITPEPPAFLPKTSHTKLDAAY